MSTVFFKLATTGLPRYGPAEVVSIGAVTSDGIEFQEFINPIGKIHRGASKVHGFHKVRGQLYLDGTRVLNAMDPESGLNSFMDWLEHVDCTFLVAHNNFAFHWEVLEQNLVEYQIPPPTFQVIDSLQFVQDGKNLRENKSFQNQRFSFVFRISDAPEHCLARLLVFHLWN